MPRNETLGTEEVVNITSAKRLADVMPRSDPG